MKQGIWENIEAKIKAISDFDEKSGWRNAK